MASAPARNRATDQEVAASEKARDSMEKGYELGVVTIVDLLNAQKQLSEARKAQLQARYRYFKARSALLYQAGGLVIEELVKLNKWLVVTK
jgi:outer membrane protein